LGTDTAEAHPSVPSDKDRDQTFGLEPRRLRIQATVAQGDLAGTRRAVAAGLLPVRRPLVLI